MAQIFIGNVVIACKVLVTGGGPGASGWTTVGGNATPKSQGTAIQIGQDAGIVVSGDARIVQT